MRIRKQALKVLRIPPLPPPSSSSSVLNPPPSYELIGSKQTEEKADPTGKESSMEPQTRTVPSKSGLGAETEKGKRPRSPAEEIICRRSDGKGWRCKREAVQGSSLCEYHLSLSRRRCSSSSASIKMKKVTRTQKKRKEENEAAETRTSSGSFGRLDDGDGKMDRSDRGVVQPLFS